MPTASNPTHDCQAGDDADAAAPFDEPAAGRQVGGFDFGERAIDEFEIAGHERRNRDPRLVLQLVDPLLGIGQQRGHVRRDRDLRRLNSTSTSRMMGIVSMSGFQPDTELTLLRLESLTYYTRIDQPSRDMTQHTNHQKATIASA